MNSLKLFGACGATSNSVIKRYAFSQKDRILLLHKDIKSLYGPIINTKKPKRSKKLSGPPVKHETVSTSATSPDGVALKNPETNYSSEMYWIIGNRWNEIFRKGDAKVGNVSRTFKYEKIENVSSNIDTQTSEVKSAKPKKSIDLEIVDTSAPPIIQKPIPLSNEELKNVLNCPLQSDVLSTPPSDIRAPELRTLPSVGRVLQYTMSEAARSALLNWKLTKIRELGEQGFAELQKANLSSGLIFHSSLQQYFLTSEIPTDSSPAFKLWESVRGVLDTFTAMPVSVEKTVHHPILKYKGICDCVSEVDNQLTIIEWKKSGRSKPTLDATYDAPLQLCAYLGAINCTPEFQGRIRQGMVVIAYENGKQADVYKMDEVMLRNYWRVWLKRLHEYWIRTRDDTLPEPI
ncbi:mitochondrial genome maintenance exonuclease 1-like [Bradysia coprophila]|uniref:mitochondrial genome maintenance exonuclease 1-like n=1 Tax=Bradysia coprophila TaxID=38358 RepID=UPI00187DACE7|nr:mitochondrial genome maintenance exonuclease 1-like [Bradysia coprophila]